MQSKSLFVKCAEFSALQIVITPFRFEKKKQIMSKFAAN
jgi:hypothetical protein